MTPHCANKQENQLKAFRFPSTHQITLTVVVPYIFPCNDYHTSGCKVVEVLQEHSLNLKGSFLQVSGIAADTVIDCSSCPGINVRPERCNEFVVSDGELCGTKCNLFAKGEDAIRIDLQLRKTSK